MNYGKSKIIGFGALAVCTLLSPVKAHADYASINVISYSPGTIDVLSNGTTYNEMAIPLVSLNSQLRVNLDAGDSGRVKSWKAWVKVKLEKGTWIQFSNDYDSASYSIPRPKEVNTVAVVKVPFGTLQPFALSQCNAMATRMRGVGLSNAQIFAKDRILTFAIDGALSYENSGIPGADGPPEVQPSFSSMKHFKVNCKAKPYAGPTRKPVAEPNDPTRNIPTIKRAALVIQGVSLSNGTCKLKLSGFIEGKEANQQIKFRYKDKDGNQSDIKTVMSGEGFSHQYNLVGTGLKQGKIYIDIEGENFNSPQKNYSVNCTPNAPGGLSTGTTGGGGAGASSAGSETAVPKQPGSSPVVPGRLKVAPRKTLKKRTD